MDDKVGAHIKGFITVLQDGGGAQTESETNQIHIPIIGNDNITSIQKEHNHC